MRAASTLPQPEELDIELLPFLGEVDTLGVVLGRGETQASARPAGAARYSLHEEPELVGRFPGPTYA